MRAAARRPRATAGVRAIAVCFLYGFIRPEHEQRAVAILREEIPDAFISAGHEVAPEFREYERLSTVVLNAYLGPVMRDYLEQLGPRLAALGLTATPHLTQSNGGVIGFATAAAHAGADRPVGPRDRRGRRAGDRRAVGLQRPHHLRHGRHLDRRGPAAGRPAASSPAKPPCTAIRSRRRCSTSTPSARAAARSPISTAGGLLKVGPRSAGADPGPVCYGRGNDEPTVTDANVVLQTLNPRHLLGGRMTIRQRSGRAGDRAAGRQAWART